MSRDAAHWIRALELAPHPEGGAFREAWRASELVAAPALPPRFGGARSLGTAIYYLLAAGERSRLHRLQGDELWHHYDGGPLVLHVFHAGVGYRRRLLGTDTARNEEPMIAVPHGSWFGAEVGEGAAFALVGCTVAPGFEFTDFELGERAALLAEFPAQRALIERLSDGRS